MLDVPSMEELGLAQERTRPSRTTSATPSSCCGRTQEVLANARPAFCRRSTRALAARAKPVPTRPQRPGAAVLRRANEPNRGFICAPIFGCLPCVLERCFKGEKAVERKPMQRSSEETRRCAGRRRTDSPHERSRIATPRHPVARRPPQDGRPTRACACICNAAKWLIAWGISRGLTCCSVQKCTRIGSNSAARLQHNWDERDCKAKASA